MLYNEFNMKILIETIPHSEQRYHTCGDYYFDTDGTIHVKISHTEDKYDQAIIIHELFELFSILNKGIKVEDIDAFDIAFEKLREEHPLLIGDQEPGDMITAPYFEDHQKATEVEKVFATHNGIDWDIYNNVINNL